MQYYGVHVNVQRLHRQTRTQEHVVNIYAHALHTYVHNALAIS